MIEIEKYIKIKYTNLLVLKKYMTFKKFINALFHRFKILIFYFSDLYKHKSLLDRFYRLLMVMLCNINIPHAFGDFTISLHTLAYAHDVIYMRTCKSTNIFKDE